MTAITEKIRTVDESALMLALHTRRDLRGRGNAEIPLIARNAILAGVRAGRCEQRGVVLELLIGVLDASRPLRLLCRIRSVVMGGKTRMIGGATGVDRLFEDAHSALNILRVDIAIVAEPFRRLL